MGGRGCQRAGLLLNVLKSKMDQDGHAQVVAVAHGQHALSDLVAALIACGLCAARHPARCSPGSGRTRSASNPCPGTSSPGCRARAEAAGLDGTRITAHSLRAGHATTAALAGVPLDRIAAPTRHKDLTVLVNRYIRPLEALATTSSKDLGL